MKQKSVLHNNRFVTQSPTIVGVKLFHPLVISTVFYKHKVSYQRLTGLFSVWVYLGSELHRYFLIFTPQQRFHTVLW